MTRHRDWTTKEERFLLVNYKKLGPAACAEHLGRTKNAVMERAKLMRNRGIKVPYIRKRVTDKELERVREMWIEGKTIEQIAFKLNVKETRVVYFLKCLKLSGVRGRLWTPEEEQEVLAMLASGWSYRLIAKALDRTEAAVNSRIYKMKQKGDIENVEDERSNA